jgi:hypothetical protein
MSYQGNVNQNDKEISSYYTSMATVQKITNAFIQAQTRSIIWSNYPISGYR